MLTRLSSCLGCAGGEELQMRGGNSALGLESRLEPSCAGCELFKGATSLPSSAPLVQTRLRR